MRHGLKVKLKLNLITRQFHSTAYQLTQVSEQNEPITIDFKNSTIITKTEEHPKRERGRIKPTELKRMRYSNPFFGYNSDRMNKEAYKLIVSEKRQKKSFSFTLDPSKTEQETVYLHDENETKTTTLKPPLLSGELHRVLYQPMTLHQLKDTRSNVYLFDPKLEKISPDYLEKKAFPEDSNPLFVTPHKDKSLMKVANENNKKYISSSSSMTSILSQMHFLLSNFRQLNIKDTPISNNFKQYRCNYTRSAKFPATVIMRKKDDRIRSIDSDRSFDKEIVLSILGHSLESFLTNDTNNKDYHDDFYHYSKIDDFIIRSQLDAFDPKLPGTGVFDLKTRAVSAIRHDLSYVEQNNNFTGYRIDKIHGQYESLEREFYELIRSTLLKYSLQSRIGKMDGIFVAYHNISKIFGFQYLPQEELDFIIHSKYNEKFANILNRRNDKVVESVGQKEYIVKHLLRDREIAEKVAETEFKLSLMLLKNVLKYVEDQIDRKVGKNKWNMCKIMMNTREQKIRLPNKEVVQYPILDIIAYPLPLDYKDDLVISTNIAKEDIEKSISKHWEGIQKQANDPQFKEHMVGLELRVFHKQRMVQKLKQSTKFSKETYWDTLEEKSLKVTKEQVHKSYYSKVPTFQTPNFFHPDDVGTWKIDALLTPSTKPDILSQLYLAYSGTKLDALKHQSLVEDIDQKVPEELATKRNSDNSTTNNSNKSNEKNKSTNNFKEILRAYGIKGSIAESKIDAKKTKRMWNT